jgi:hypothetical protein
MHMTISKAEKDVENSCVVLETDRGQEWVSCAECRVGETACNYLKSAWGVSPCLYRKGVRLGRGLTPDPRDAVKIIQMNVDIYLNMMDRMQPVLKAERDIVERVLHVEIEELERARGMLYSIRPEER